MTSQEINDAVARKLGYYERTDFTAENPMYPIPDYCTSIEAAFEILIGFERWWMTKDKDGVVCTIMNEEGTHLSTFGSTTPMAICLAFLKLPN